MSNLHVDINSFTITSLYTEHRLTFHSFGASLATLMTFQWRKPTQSSFRQQLQHHWSMS